MFTLQQRLMHVTRLLHRQIEQNPFVNALNDGDSLDEPYKWLLKSLYPFIERSERKLITFLPKIDDFDIVQRCRSHLLYDDLTRLGITPETSEIVLFDRIDTMGKAIGLLYVLEGSRKGGQYLSSLLDQKKTILPMSYLIGYGEKTDFEWERFCNLLERYNNSSIQVDIEAGAIIAFEILEKMFHDK